MVTVSQELLTVSFPSKVFITGTTGLHNNVQMFLFLWSLSILIALKWPWHQQDNPYHMHITFPLLISKAKILI